jgi:hypothetical protein
MRITKSAALLFVVAAGCGTSGNADSDDPSNRGGGGGSSGQGFVFPSANAGAGAGSGAGTSAHDFDGCVAEVSQGEQVPLDIYIMFDTSCSMGCSPWKAGPGQCCNDPDARIHGVRSAVEQFLLSPENVGISAGIGYFGFMPFETTSCDPAYYATPEVPIGPLSVQGQAIVDSLNGHIPIGETPTGAAIRGACTYTRAWYQQNPSHVVVTLLVTDGMPEAPLTASCSPTIADAAAAAAECAGQVPQIPTFVLGVGSNLQELNQIAASGGTQAAYLVEGLDVHTGVFEALNSIRGIATVPCEFKIPIPVNGEALDFDKVNVEHTVGTTSSLIYRVTDAASCDAEQGGWYYDTATPPHDRILLCPATCSRVENTSGGQVDVALGCRTELVPR